MGYTTLYTPDLFQYRLQFHTMALRNMYLSYMYQAAK